MRISHFIVFILGYVASLSAQVESPGHFEGRVIDLYNHPLEYSHIINITQSFGVVADQSGRFIVPASEGDSLLISHLSHIPRIFRVEFRAQATGLLTEIVLLPKIFELKEYVVKYLPRNKLEFRHDFVHLRLPQPQAPIDIRLPNIHTMVYSGPESGFGIVIKGPFQALYDQFSKEARSKRKLESELAKEMTRKMVELKYNKQLVSSLTGIRENDSLQAFMDYCNLPDELILETTQYQLCIDILQCFESYQAR